MTVDRCSRAEDPGQSGIMNHRPICSFFDAISECSSKLVAVGHGAAFAVVDGAIYAVNLEPPIRVLPASKTVIPTRVDMLSTGWSVVAFEDLPGLVEASRKIEMLAKLAAPFHLDGAKLPNDPVTE